MYHFVTLSGSSVNKLKSEVHVTIPVEVKFVNRARSPVQLEWITPQGRREKKKNLGKGRCWRTTSWEGHYWVCCDPKKDDHLFALNYGLHYRVQKTRGARERVVITAGRMLHFIHYIFQGFLTSTSYSAICHIHDQWIVWLSFSCPSRF